MAITLECHTMSIQVPRDSNGLTPELLRQIWHGQVAEAELVQALQDPECDPWVQYQCIAGLGGMSGDDVLVATVIRSKLATPPVGAKTRSWFQACCLGALVRRVGPDARQEVQWAWKSGDRQLRASALRNMSRLGDTSHYSEALGLFRRALTKGQRSAGGFSLDELSTYLFSCVRNGTGDASAVLTLIRSNWNRMPETGGARMGYSRALPGIDNPNVPLYRITIPGASRP